MTNSKLTVRKVAATGAEVRAWARENGFEVGARGRLNPEAVAAFNKTHKGFGAYREGVQKPVKTKTVRVGRRERTVPVAEAREVLRQAGEPVGKRGRLSEFQVLRALELTQD